MVAINHEKKPFDDKRVRRALSLALDRYEGCKALSRIAIVKEVAGIQVPGTPFATPPEELAKLAGYWKDITASRAEAKKLLKEAGAEKLSFTYKNRGVPMPYEPLAVWVIDQWRQVGISVKQEVVEAAAYYGVLRSGDFEVAADFQCGFIVEPDLDIYKFQSRQHPRQLRPVHRPRARRPLREAGARPSSPRSARSTCARSRSGSSTRRRTT